MAKLVRESLLNEDLKDELIDTVMGTVYKDDDPENENSNRKYLKSLPVSVLDKMAGDYYLFDIEREKRG